MGSISLNFSELQFKHKGLDIHRFEFVTFNSFSYSISFFEDSLKTTSKTYLSVYIRFLKEKDCNILITKNFIEVISVFFYNEWKNGIPLSYIPKMETKLNEYFSSLFWEDVDNIEFGYDERTFNLFIKIKE